MKWLQWLRREWTLLRTYRRRHVRLLVRDCTVIGSLDLASVAVVLTDPLVAALREHTGGNPRDLVDVELAVTGCMFRNGKVEWPTGAAPVEIKLFGDPT